MPENFLKEIYDHGYFYFSKDGYPINYDRTGKSNIKQILEGYTIDELGSYFIQEHEYLIHIIFPMCSA